MKITEAARTILSMAFLSATLPSLASAQTAQTVPPSPYIAKGACPFECCTYRDWTARQTITLYDRPNGKVVGKLDKGAQVRALTGEVHSRPVRFVATHDRPEAKITAGEIIYLLHYLGEGSWSVWHNGQIVALENFPESAPVPKTTWWVKLSLRSGLIAWAVSNGNFANQDACG